MGLTKPACLYRPSPIFIVFRIGVNQLAKKSPPKSELSKKEMDAEIRAAMNQPWLQMKSGLIVMGIASVIFAGFVAWQLAPSEGWLKAIGWGLIFGAAMWAIFIGGLWFQRWIRRGQK